MRLCVTGGNITEAFQWTQWIFFPLASHSAPVTHKSTGSIPYTYNEKVKSILQATAFRCVQNVNMKTYKN